MYALVLILHSWNRWLVLASAIATLAVVIRDRMAGRPGSAADHRLSLLFIGALDLQALLGLLLYFVLSPIIPKTLSEYRAAMHVGALRFFAVEHVTMMLLALIVAHASWAYAKRAPTGPARQRRVSWGVGASLLLILSSIPWPWLAAGRPLFHWVQ